VTENPPAFAYGRVRAGQAIPGVLVINDRAAVGAVIDAVLLFTLCSVTGEWNGRVLFV